MIFTGEWHNGSRAQGHKGAVAQWRKGVHIAIAIVPLRRCAFL